MVFSSAVFLFAFLPVVLLVYRLLPGIRSRNAWLALSSVVFYAFGRLSYVPLFLLSVCINYLAGAALGRFRQSRAVLAAAVALNLGILGLFKYADFLLSNLNALLGLSIPLPGIVLPIGISFYTFQGLSYVIDVYRDPGERSRSFFELLLYIAFFPQLIAGPIVKYHDIAPQLRSRHPAAEDVASGLARFITGLAKKLLLANTAGLVADRVFDELLPAGLLDARLAWLGAVCYTLQIYFDFSGYSDMAIGLGRCFGLTIKENFDLPYCALSMRDFWRRWHISLSTWFREYLYIPLGGNRRGRGRTLLNRMLVFLCTGIWHGANWTFVLWGLLHGALTCLEDAGLIPTGRLSRSRPGRLLCRVYTLLSVTLLFVLFRSASLASAGQMLAVLFTAPAAANSAYLLRSLVPPATALLLGISLLAAFGLGQRVKARVRALPAGGQTLCLYLGRGFSLALLALCLLNLSRGGFNPFIYFQF